MMFLIVTFSAPPFPPLPHLLLQNTPLFFTFASPQSLTTQLDAPSGDCATLIQTMMMNTYATRQLKNYGLVMINSMCKFINVANTSSDAVSMSHALCNNGKPCR